MKTRLFGAACALALIASFAAHPAVADERGELTLDRAKVEAYIAAERDVAPIARLWTQRIESAITDAERERMLDMANDEIRMTIERAPNITPSEYTVITGMIRSSPLLYEQTQEIAREMRR